MSNVRKFSHAQFISGEEQIRIQQLNNAIYASVDEHGHDFVELLYVRSGKGLHKVNDKSFLVSAGDVFVLQTGVTHSFDPLSPSFSWIDCMFLPAFVDFEIGMLLSEKKYYGADGFEVDFLFQSMLREYEEKREGYLTKIRGYLLALLAELARQNADEDESSAAYGTRKKKRLVNEALRFVRDRYRDKISLDEAAAELQISRSYLSKLFRETLGASFVAYANQYRLERSAELLRTTETLVRHVALDCGFSDEKLFRTLFRRAYGMTPGEYRRGR
ncbi:helix-turn-helix domain-containing protein [Cohnella sp. GCM10027633]|uniref:helix-turn-helix domain-containing protein n=1 Tax=unclassified Cohnella TaxID=2636738 RepID=UPI00364460D7